MDKYNHVRRFAINRKLDIRNLIFLFALTIMTFCSYSPKTDSVIYISDEPTTLEKLAAKEIRRYTYLRTGTLLDIREAETEDQKGIILSIDNQMEEHEYRLKTLGEILNISAGSDQGLLYAAYELAEQDGVGFYLHGDVLPDNRHKFYLPVLDIHEKPLFNLRGIQPFHDFPEGPDWWNANDYKAIMAQLVKMKMNFIGFHTYPENKNWNGQGYRPGEPLVWIGKEEDIEENGNVRQAYPTAHFYTNDSTWGYGVAHTSDFSMGASQIFESDIYGADYMKDMPPWPRTEEQNIRIFNQTGEMFGEVFGFARKLGLKTCIGTETPLIIPDNVRDHYGIENESEEEVKELYRGMFSRINKLYPVDYYWLWTPEYWTWSEVSEEAVARTERDMQIAYEVLEEMDKPFQLATCGWVLGPPADRSQFDRILPKDMPFSCINRGVGYSPVEKSFSNISGRPKWSIPWLEDDPDMISTQLWAGRVRKDALDSYLYGCDGLFGIHWRTRMVGPNISALAEAAWHTDEWVDQVPDTVRDLSAIDFYVEWVQSQFGIFDPSMAGIFASLDSKGYEEMEGHKGDAPLNASDWIEGPGALMMNPGVDELKEHISRYDFLPKLRIMRKKIRGRGNQERFDYWVNSFNFNRAILVTALKQKMLDELIQEIKNIDDPRKQAEMADEKALPLRIELAESWKEMTQILLSKISTNGEMGTLANLELHSLRKLNYLYGHDEYLKSLGVQLPPEAFLPDKYRGHTRVIVTTNQSIIEEGEDFYLRIRILSENEELSGHLFWKELGPGSYKTVKLNHIARNVFDVSIPSGDLHDDFEYYIQVKSGGQEILYPATAKMNNLSVVLMN